MIFYVSIVSSCLDEHLIRPCVTSEKTEDCIVNRKQISMTSWPLSLITVNYSRFPQKSNQLQTLRVCPTKYLTFPVQLQRSVLTHSVLTAPSTPLFVSQSFAPPAQEPTKTHGYISRKLAADITETINTERKKSGISPNEEVKVFAYT